MLTQSIRSFLEISKALGPPFPLSALPPWYIYKRFTSINFAKNQLSLSLIGLSPLATNHPHLLPQMSVRPSKRCYAFFSLFIARSLSFGSHETNQRNFLTRFCFASTSSLKLAYFMQSLTHYAKGTPLFFTRTSTACQFFISGSFSLPFLGFFSPFPYGTRTLSVSKTYLGLEGGPPIFKQKHRSTFLQNSKRPYWTITIFGRFSQIFLYL